MDISTGLIAKGTAGLATAAAATSGVIYRENIANFLRTGSFVIQPAQAGKASLGLPANWSWPSETTTPTESELTVEQLKKVNFDGKLEEDLNVTGDSGVILRIEKINADNDFPQGFKFIFKSKENNTATITGGTVSITLKKDMNLEFKIKEEGGKWSLERAWTVNKLAGKVGLTCTDSPKECSFNSGTPIKVYESENNKTTTATVSDTTKKLLFTEDEENHNQGFKFVVKDSSDISLASGGSVSSLIKANTSYEIKYQNDGWYLSKKTSAPAA